MNDKQRTFTILIADDDEMDCELMDKALERAIPLSARLFVENGEELLDYLYKRNEFSEPGSAPVPDLILLDLNMPVKDGREALKEIRQDHDLCSIPIVILTTSEEEWDIRTCYKLGANSYITKPYRFENLVKTMEVISQYWFHIAKLPPSEGNRPLFSHSSF
jgi:CheY-like chemotaxis protein